MNTSAIGRLVYGDSNDSFKEWADMMMWDGTVTTELIPEEQLFTKVIGLSQQEYKLLRFCYIVMCIITRDGHGFILIAP